YHQRRSLRHIADAFKDDEQHIPQPVLHGERRDRIEQRVERTHPEHEPASKKDYSEYYKIMHAERPYFKHGHERQPRARRGKRKQAQPEKAAPLLTAHEQKHRDEHLEVKVQLPEKYHRIIIHLLPPATVKYAVKSFMNARLRVL